jgi:hypothetical protein
MAEINEELNENEDSFGNKMDQVYESSQKKDGFEIHNSQRPISKYDRNQQVKQNITEEKFDLKKFLERFNSHLKNNQITKNEFADTTSVLVNKTDFKAMFKNINFDIKNFELDYLFSEKNPNKDDGYIIINTFIENYDLDFYPTNSQIINQTNSNYNKNKSTSSIPSKSESEIKKAEKQLNIDFESFKNDILNIVIQQENTKKNKKKNLQPIKKPPQSGKNKKINNKKNNLPGLEKKNSKKYLKPINNNDDLNNDENNKDNEENNNNNSFSEEDSENISEKEKSKKKRPKTTNALNKHKQKKPKGYYLKQTLQREMLEEDMMRLTIEKRDKEFQRECVRKMVQANEYAEQLNIPKSYSAYNEEGDNTIVCRVFDKVTKDYKDINLKQFLLEFKKLQKLINQEKEREKYKEQKIEKISIDKNNKNETDFFKMNREQKHKVIKQILKESLELKIKLKKQLKALRDKNLIDIDTINKNLKLTNLDDDNIL